jgi:hypothetical protein
VVVSQDRTDGETPAGTRSPAGKQEKIKYVQRDVGSGGTGATAETEDRRAE